jgi:mono/diheme cytochrome c family protein
VDGEQYVAVGAGFGTLFYIVGGFAIDHKGVPDNGRILVFKLGGKAVLPKPNLTKIPVPQPPKATASAEVVAAGRMKYQTFCVYCHGYNAMGAGVIPDLRYSGLLHDPDAFKGVVLRGDRKSNGMVSFASVLSDADADAVRAYLITQANRAYDDEQTEKKSAGK